MLYLIWPGILAAGGVRGQTTNSRRSLDSHHRDSRKSENHLLTTPTSRPTKMKKNDLRFLGKSSIMPTKPEESMGSLQPAEAEVLIVDQTHVAVGGAVETADKIDDARNKMGKFHLYDPDSRQNIQP